MNKTYFDPDERSQIRDMIRDMLKRNSHLLFPNEEQFLKQVNTLLKKKQGLTTKQQDWLMKIIEKIHYEKNYQAA